MSDLNNLKSKIASVPQEPGVYLMKDKTGKVIYIGKAKSLKKRLMSYLRGDLSGKTMVMMSNVNNVEYRLTQNESLAMLLEANLIHKYKPKYNISLRDDKSFPLVKITHEEFPAICITRKRQNDGAQYLGPYTSAKLLRYALKTIRRHFPYRSCEKMPEAAAMYRRIGLAPDIKEIKRKEYARTVRNIRLILEGRSEILIQKLSRRMGHYAKEHKFEEAAKIRDQIAALSSLGLIQSGFSRQDELQDLKKLLKLNKLPQRIEAFDISDISGKEATGSMVSFYRGLTDKNNYRRFRIKTVEGIDDYKMLSEVIHRRYRRLIAEKLPLPDLILIDGGLSHLLTAQRELEKLNIAIPLISIAKEQENVYIKDSRSPIKFVSDTPALNLIRRIRDEAHRFAVSYHHILRRKKVIGR
jgi:excinuclease ABC subunit C